MKKLSLAIKTFSLFIVIILSTLAQVNNVQGIIVSGFEVASTGLIEYETSENAIETTFSIANVSRSVDNSSISPVKILWEYTDFQNNSNVVWNKTRIVLPRLTNESQIALYNATVWINESIEFWFKIWVFHLGATIIPLNWTTSITSSVDNPTIFLIIPVWCCFVGLIIIVQRRKRKRSN